MNSLLDWFNIEWFLFALVGGVAGFIVGGRIEIRIENKTRRLPNGLRSGLVVAILLAIGALFVVAFQEAARVGSFLSGFSLGLLVRKWWSVEFSNTDDKP